MAVSQVHLQAPSQSLIGTLCAEAGQLQGQARALQASMAQCGDSVLSGRLQADWLALRHRVKEIKAMAASAADPEELDAEEVLRGRLAAPCCSAHEAWSGSRLSSCRSL